MDARITKKRLGIFLSYDWLKILGVIAAAVFVFIVLFTMVGTRPTVAQNYDIFGYGDLNPGEDYNSIAGTLKDGKFSYDILEVGIQSFQSTDMGSLAFSARRGSLEGSALFVSDYTEEENGRSDFASVCTMGLVGGGTASERMGLFYDIPALLSDCEAYLARFFGEDWRTGDIDMGEVRACFLERNGNDKRFRSDAKKEEGILLEKERILRLRENYIYVKEKGFDCGNLPLTVHHTSFEAGGTAYSFDYPVGINLGKLSGINKLFFYRDAEENVSTQQLTLLFFDNGDRLKDLKYEDFALLRHLLETYAPVYS